MSDGPSGGAPRGSLGRETPTRMELRVPARRNTVEEGVAVMLGKIALVAALVPPAGLGLSIAFC